MKNPNVFQRMIENMKSFKSSCKIAETPPTEEFIKSYEEYQARAKERGRDNEG